MFIQGGDSMYNVQKNKKKNSDAKIAANDRYNKKHYKNISIRIKPDQADFIRDTAKKNNLSIAQLIINAVELFDNKTDNI